jgi:vitamin B12 transporter
MNFQKVFLSTSKVFLLFVLSYFPAVFAQGGAIDSLATEKDTLVSLPSLTVSAMRVEVEADKLPQKLELIDRQDLELTVADDITDVLKKNASVDVMQYPGIYAGIGIRGFRPQTYGINQHTLTLFNGRPAGTTNLATMQTYNIDRIEVVKGPVSALYGPQAMGGVVNVIPKRSDGDISTQLKLKIGSFETLEAVAHSGGSLFEYLNYDFSAAVFNRGKDYRIGSEYILENLDDEKYPGKPRHILSSGDTVEVEDVGDGLIRHYTKYDKQNFALRLGTDLFNDRISIDVRGEMFAADAVETPGSIAKGESNAGFKNVRRNDEQVTISGDFGKHKFKLLQYMTEDYNETFEGFAYGDTMYQEGASGANFFGFQAKDDIYLPLGGEVFKPIVTVGLDFNMAEDWKRNWEKSGSEIAPYSPGSKQKDLGLYTQLFGDVKNGLATLTSGFRFDAITQEILVSKFFPNNTAKKESFSVFSPSYGLTFSPLKLLTDDVNVTVYNNLGKGFLPQSASNIARYRVLEPDTSNRVEVLRGNPDLEPEENVTVDFGIRAGIESAGIDLAFGGYRTIVENFVESSYDSVPEGMTETYEGGTYDVASIKTYKNNDDKTTMAGLEWDFEWNILRMLGRVEKLALYTNGHVVLLSEAISAGDTSEIHNVRKKQFVIGLTYDDTKRLSARLSTRYSGEQKDRDWYASGYPKPDVLYPPFLVTDVSIRVRIDEHRSIGAAISNITDENYYEKRGFSLPGRSFAMDYELAF